ncbi:non-homologous end-joining factor 1-like [Thrips palmi]|uniref:Non-homologous end-joining factor 1 n=1 Tax=Thrips palmi TaxID=161013 RepID=A0A6P8ZR18_THRPL|nr:non-homologous end-joining factor 1-like [Thrips palmi]
MWNFIKTGRKTFVFKKCASSGTLRLIISDFIHIWVQEMSDSTLLALCQEQNPLLEFNEDEFSAQTIWTMVDNHLGSREKEDGFRSTLDLDLEEDSSLQLKFNSKMHGHPFKLNMTLLQENPNVLFNEVTSPLLLLSELLLAQQDHLFSLLEKKDLEIKQYKLEGATLSRRNIETTPFQRNEFWSSYQDSKGNLSEELSKVVDVLNLVTLQQPKSSERVIPKESASSSETAQILSPINIQMEAEGNAKEEEEEQSTIVRLPKKKRTKLNI